MTRILIVSSLVFATAALAWHPEYAWFDPPALTPTASVKPGGGGLLGTGAPYEGGVQCKFCHMNPVPGPQGHIDGGVVFTPGLTAGKYALGMQYDVTVAMSGEHFTLTAGGMPTENSFAGMFQSADGGVSGSLQSDTAGFNSSPCTATLPGTLPTAGTTLTYGDCHGIMGRGANKLGLTSWSFKWTAPSANEGPVTFYFGIVDANGTDRTVKADGGGDDDVYMGKLVIANP